MIDFANFNDWKLIEFDLNRRALHFKNKLLYIKQLKIVDFYMYFQIKHQKISDTQINNIVRIMLQIWIYF